MEHSFLSNKPCAKSEICINLFCRLRWVHQAALVGSAVEGTKNIHVAWQNSAEMCRHTVTHGRASERETVECSGYSVLFTLPRNMVYPALLPLMRTPRLPAVDRTDAPADINWLVRFAERRILVSACAPSHFNWSLQLVWSGVLVG